MLYLLLNTGILAENRTASARIAEQIVPVAYLFSASQQEKPLVLIC
jgi:hypothetical protein